jgi:hypothetical protein
VKLLADLQVVWRADEIVVATAVLLERLQALEESPWADLRGRPLDARGLANQLGAYGVKSTKVKTGGKSLNGYRREDLHDVWLRYVPAVPAEAEPPEPAEPPSSDAAESVPFARQVLEPPAATEPSEPVGTSPVPEVPRVPEIRDVGTWTPDVTYAREALDHDDAVSRLVLMFRGEVMEPAG